MYHKRNLLEAFNEKSGLALDETEKNQTAIKYIYELGSMHVREKNKPIYEHSIILYSLLESAAEFHTSSNRKIYGYNSRLITVMLAIYTTNHFWKKNDMNNISGLASFGLLKKFTKLPSFKLNARLKKLENLGFVKKESGALLAFIVKADCRKLQFYSLTPLGIEQVKQYSKTFYKLYLESQESENFKKILNYNYSINYLNSLKTKFNVSRSTFNYEEKRNQALELLVPNFKSRFPKKG